jgi:hypothetical protein
MKLRTINKKWAVKIILLGLVVLNMLGCYALAPVNKTDAKINSKFTPHLDSGSVVNPYPDKVDKGGDDVILVKDRLIAIAGGAGKWSKIGIDAGKHSKQLIKLVGEIYEKNPNATPKEILLEANNRTTEKGSSTLLIAILDPKNKKLATTMIGDSGYTIIRTKRCRGFFFTYK